MLTFDSSSPFCSISFVPNTKTPTTTKLPILYLRQLPGAGIERMKREWEKLRSLFARNLVSFRAEVLLAHSDGMILTFSYTTKVAVAAVAAVAAAAAAAVAVANRKTLLQGTLLYKNMKKLEQHEVLQTRKLIHWYVYMYGMMFILKLSIFSYKPTRVHECLLIYAHLAIVFSLQFNSIGSHEI